MKEPSCVVAVDVGNSAAKLCLMSDDHPACEKKSSSENRLSEISIPIDNRWPSEPQGSTDPVTSDVDWITQAVQWVESHTRCRPCRTQWRIASVQRSASRQLCDRLRRDAENQLADSDQVNVDVRTITRDDVPMPVLVDHPDRLGIDRLVGAFAASELYRPPLVVVDAGSAVTVDWVDARGRFCGGAILPGLGLQLQALARGTDALPQIDLLADGDCQTPLSMRPATNTSSAIRLGVITAVAAAIDRLAENYGAAEPTDSPPTVILTGGDAGLISAALQVPHQVVSRLVCRGLLALKLGK
ncbi:type III pantothenate kinase [Stieleria varia]|uniref:Type III pantothenate kinase n=1 Tax=Stieleria varia TaxID=2528005 RepID=A0A5C6B6G5_9BACT|nr:type III pantothenate kinase [Stieleria varia]TWU07875.1 Type III pantothenate kinase [Stieleria varia]